MMMMNRNEWYDDESKWVIIEWWMEMDDDEYNNKFT